MPLGPEDSQIQLRQLNDVQIEIDCPLIFLLTANMPLNKKMANYTLGINNKVF